MSRSCTLNPELLQQFIKERQNTSPGPEDNDPTGGYLTMRSYPVHLQQQEGTGVDNAEVFSIGAHREVAPSYVSVRQRIQSAPEESHNLINASNTVLNLPEPLVPTIPKVSSSAATDKLNVQPTLLPSQYSLATAALNDGKNTGLVKSTAEEALIPSSVRFIYPRPIATSTSASTTTSSTVSGVSTRPGVVDPEAPPVPTRPDRRQDQSHIPPKPAQRAKRKSESDALSTVPQANGGVSTVRPPAIPPRIQTQQQQQAAAAAAGGSPQSQQKAKKRPMPPPRRPVHPGPHEVATQLSPKITHPGSHGSTGFSESEIRIQTLILSDPEFQSCTPEVCKQALKRHKYEIEAAKEEIRVHMLMEMQVAYITAEDCRRALSHCQQKMDRAAAWLLEQSDDIERRRQ